MTVEAVVLVLGTFAFAGVVLWVSRRGPDGPPTGPSMAEFAEASQRIWELEQAVDLLPQKWEEMAQRAKRSEDRARAVVRRAREELEEEGYEHPGVEAEARQLGLLDGGGGEGGGVQPVPGRVEADQQGSPDGLEPWERETLMHKYGRA